MQNILPSRQLVARDRSGATLDAVLPRLDARRRDSHLGLRTELETLAGHAKGKGTSGRPARPKVPMGQSGADRPIVAMKRGNARGAKGVGHSRRCWVNGRPEEPSFFAGRRRPSLSGTSRMRREFSRPDVCPAKAGMFSRRKACRGKNQKPRSLDSRVAGNQDPEAYRQRLPRGDDELPGRNNSERKSGLESE